MHVYILDKDEGMGTLDPSMVIAFMNQSIE